MPEIWLGPWEFEVSQVTLTNPISGMVYHPDLLWSTYLPKLKPLRLYLHPLRRYERRHKIQKLGGMGYLRPGSLKVIANSTIRYSAYEFLLAFLSNYVTMLHRFWDSLRREKIAIDNIFLRLNITRCFVIFNSFSQEKMQCLNRWQANKSRGHQPFFQNKNNCHTKYCRIILLTVIMSNNSENNVQFYAAMRELLPEHNRNNISWTEFNSITGRPPSR